MTALTIDYTPIFEFRYCQIVNNNFNFLLLDENLKALHSPFQCKDYLQDIFYCENTETKSDIFGLLWLPGRIRLDVKTYRMVLMGGKENLRPHIKAFKSFINKFDRALKFKLTQVKETDDERNIVVVFDAKWTKNGPLLSAFTTIIRLSQMYTGGDVINYLQNLRSGEVKTPAYMQVEIERLEVTLTRLAALLKGRMPEHNWKDFSSVVYAHGKGIMGFSNFPEEKIT